MIFGHDIFNNKKLTFEPEMNIATPSDYKLGPGDAVFIDIWGASQKSISSTVSPEGEIDIEGFGPIQVSGLTVAQANSRLKATIGSRYSGSNIKLSVGQTKTISVNVMGAVETPGTYTLSAFSTVSMPSIWLAVSVRLVRCATSVFQKWTSDFNGGHLRLHLKRETLGQHQT